MNLHAPWSNLQLRWLGSLRVNHADLSVHAPTKFLVFFDCATYTPTPHTSHTINQPRRDQFVSKWVMMNSVALRLPSFVD